MVGGIWRSADLLFGEEEEDDGGGGGGDDDDELVWFGLFSVKKLGRSSSVVLKRSTGKRACT